MLYLVAILLPPLGVLLAGKPFQAILNIPLTLLFYVPGLLHALFVVHNHYADQRTERIVRATEAAAAQSAQLAQQQAQATLAMQQAQATAAPMSAPDPATSRVPIDPPA